MSRFGKAYISYLKDQNAQLEYCCKFWREEIKKVPGKSEQHKVLQTTMALLTLLRSLNDDILATEEKDAL